MEFEWDDEKQQQNLNKHKVNLLYAALIFEGPTLTREDNRQDYGETRLISLGLIDDAPTWSFILSEMAERV